MTPLCEAAVTPLFFVEEVASHRYVLRAHGALCVELVEGAHTLSRLDGTAVGVYVLALAETSSDECAGAPRLILARISRYCRACPRAPLTTP